MTFFSELNRNGTNTIILRWCWLNISQWGKCGTRPGRFLRWGRNRRGRWAAGKTGRRPTNRRCSCGWRRRRRRPMCPNAIPCRSVRTVDRPDQVLIAIVRCSSVLMVSRKFPKIDCTLFNCVCFGFLMDFVRVSGFLWSYRNGWKTVRRDEWHWPVMCGRLPTTFPAKPATWAPSEKPIRWNWLTDAPGGPIKRSSQTSANISTKLILLKVTIGNVLGQWLLIDSYESSYTLLTFFLLRWRAKGYWPCLTRNRIKLPRSRPALATLRTPPG